MESSKVDTSYLSQQVNSIINQLHGLFDDIGVADNDRENRESEVRLPPVRACTCIARLERCADSHN